jgi:two-component system OmpR family response regulator
MLRIFLVEDNHLIRENLIETLQDLSDSKIVGVAETELDAVTWLHQNASDWDLVIIDLFLKQGSGLTVLQACLNRTPSQKALVLSNYAFAEEVKARCFQLGANAVFDKSNEIDELVSTCKKLANREC